MDDGSLPLGWRRRLGPRVVLLPMIILIVGWLLQSQATSEEARRVATITEDVRQFVIDSLGSRAGETLGEAAPGLRGPAVDAVRSVAGDLDAGRIDIEVLRGDAGPGHPSAGTHTATILGDGQPRLHLRVGVVGDRTMLAGWWRPEAMAEPAAPAAPAAPAPATTP
jgi:hypothetical protein